MEAIDRALARAVDASADLFGAAARAEDQHQPSNPHPSHLLHGRHGTSP